jgi:hypothetical protein
VVLACSFLLPIVGWVILPLWVLVSGLGAFVLALKELKSQSPSDQTPALVPGAEKIA